MSVPYSNISEIEAKPVREVAEEDSRPSTACIAVSSGRATCSSTTSGLAPGWEAITAICGNSREGINSCFREPIEIKPKMAENTVISAIKARFFKDRLAKRCMRMRSYALKDEKSLV